VGVIPSTLIVSEVTEADTYRLTISFQDTDFYNLNDDSARYDLDIWLCIDLEGQVSSRI
jgi:hypothetical protein